MTTVTISLPESLKQFVDSQVANKGYGNVSEYFRTLLREAQERERDPRLEALLLEGLASGDPIPIDENFWTDLKAEAIRSVEARNRQRKTGETLRPTYRAHRHSSAIRTLSGIGSARSC